MEFQGLTATSKQGKKYLSIKQGMLFYKCEEVEHPAFEEKKSEFQGKEFINRGLWFGKLEDTITKVECYDGTFGMQIVLTTALGYIVQIKWDSRYGVHLMEKLVSDKLDLSKPITLHPYNFENEGKRIQGMNILQDGEKIPSFYFDAETKKDPDTFPKVPEAKNGKKITSVAWQNYYAQRSGHLLELFEDWIEKQSFRDAEPQTQATQTTASTPTNHIDDVQGDDGKVEDLPF